MLLARIISSLIRYHRYLNLIFLYLFPSIVSWSASLLLVDLADLTIGLIIGGAELLGRKVTIGFSG